MSIEFLDLGKVNRPYIDELQAAAARVVASGRYIGGPEVDTLQRHMAELCQVPHAIGVSNGLDALRLILRSYCIMGLLSPGDEVIVPANTYIATILAIVDAGLEPRLVDPDPVTMNLTGEIVADNMSSRTRAIMPVHLYGRIAWDQLMAQIAREHSLLVIEDAAQAIGAHSSAPGLFGTTAAGSLGHGAGFSFYPTKNVGALGDGGIVTTHSSQLAATISSLANYGYSERYHCALIGFNCRLDPLQAALVDVKLRHIDDENIARRERATLYSSLITNPLVALPPMPADPLECVWHQYVIRCQQRDELRGYLAQQGIATDIHYPIPPHLQECFAGRWPQESLPVTTMLARQVLSLPISSATTLDEVTQVAEAINLFTPLTH